MSKRSASSTVETDPSRASSIPDALRRAAVLFGPDESVVDGAAHLGFAELLEQVEQVGLAFLASDLKPGDRVALWAPNSAEWIVASFAVYAAGGILVPINTRFKGEEAHHILRTSRAKFLLSVSDFLGSDLVSMARSPGETDDVQETVILNGPRRDGTVAWEDFTARSSDANQGEIDARTDALSARDVSDIIFTSGTTGLPKGAMLTHGASVRTYAEWSRLVGLRRGDRYLIVYPFFHTAGLKSGILACVLQGATAIPQAVFDVDQVMRRVSEERITMLPGPPTVFQSIWNHPDFASFDLSSLRLCVTGAATVPVDVVRRMREDMHFETVVTGYGLTETTGTVSMCRHDDPPDVIAKTVGRPLPGVEVKIVGRDDESLGAEEQGEILVRGFNVMLGYLDDDAATAEAIDAEGWLRTGDIGFIGNDGNLRITDRKKDMFIVGGFNAYPAEIEGIIIKHPGVAQVAVVGTPDDRLGEVGAAFVVPRSGSELDATELIDWCRDHMANYKVPRFVEFVDGLPLNPSGKVMKFLLREGLLSSIPGDDAPSDVEHPG
ncbi:MAG TPA: FadD3 family acyl-CoA ligase [Acidimicrobiales bacterium]|nr:FadD3 family acyl-CoA ligase [Acidimicrobiales bacterium]